MSFPQRQTNFQENFYMRQYELTVILSPVLDEEKRRNLIEKIKNFIEKGKGKIKETNDWGKRPLIYPIKKQTEGFYLLFDFELEEKSAAEIEKKIFLEVEIIRHLLIRKD